MAKGQKRSNREQKKPKGGQEKPKPTVGQTALTALHERPAAPTPTKKK
jgi:hypothetical protein